MNRLIDLLNQYTGVDRSDINCVIHEIDPGNYFGGVNHSYMDDLKRKGT